MASRLIRPAKPQIVRGIRLPRGLGRLMWSPDTGEASIFSREWFGSNLAAIHRDGDGKLRNAYDLGSGLVTNVGVLALANDPAWAAPSETVSSTLGSASRHASGTGTTAASASNVALETLAKPNETEAVNGTNTLISAANKQELRSIATITYESSLAITEWGLFCQKILTATTGTPFTKTTATSAIATGTPFTESTKGVQGLQKQIVKAGTTTVWGLILKNTKSEMTIPAWYKTADGTAGATPGETEAFSLLATMWDRKVFSAINVVSGDSIEFKYNLLINSGG